MDAETVLAELQKFGPGVDQAVVSANIHAFTVLATAIRNVKKTRQYRAAGEALDWLLSLDSAAFMHQLNLAPIIPKVLRHIEYESRYREIIAAATADGAEGRAWLAGPAKYRLDELMNQARIYFKAEQAVIVAA